MEARYRDATGIAALKIRHNAVLGYFVEVPARHGDALMAADSGFTHRQTMAGAVRFNSPELHEEAMRIAQAGAHAVTAEAAHLEELIGMALERRDAISAAADALARHADAHATAVAQCADRRHADRTHDVGQQPLPGPAQLRPWPAGERGGSRKRVTRRALQCALHPNAT